MQDITAIEKITKARAALICSQPFFGSLALRLAPIADTSIDTMSTDGQTLKYNPSFVDTLTLDTCKGVICHEVMHCACGHQARRGNRDPRRWNESGDYAINGIIEQARLVLPQSRLIDSRFDGMSAEAIYSQLGEDSGDDSGDTSKDDSSASSEATDGNGAQGDGQPNDDGQPSDDGNGDGQPSNDPGQCGAVTDATQPDGTQASASDMAQAAQDWQIATAQAAQQARAMGSLPSALERLIDGIVNPVIDWRDALRRFVSQTARNDYRWTPPNRRYVYLGLYLPSCRNEELPPLVVAVDTSGSISAEVLRQFGAELSAILESYQTSATVIYCDAHVNKVEEYTSDDLPLTLKAIGGGGTNFAPVFAHVESMDVQPSCLVYLTDLCGTFPDVAPEYPVLWARIGDYGEAPPFGEVVSIS